jgi:DnaJ-domain-containing protein 1
MELVFVIVVLTFLLIVVFRKNNDPWENTAIKHHSQDPEAEYRVNKIPYLTFYTTRNIMVVYAYLAGWIMKQNVSDSRQKIQFIQLYFNRYFKGSENISEEMRAALRYATNVPSIVKWVNRKMKDPSEKQQLLEFLIALSMEDGAITQAEFDAIVWFGKGIGFTQVELEQWIQAKKDQHYRQQQSQHAPPPVYRSATKKQEALKILGADTSISLVELKKLYRNLVKLYHPDTLINPSETEKSEAEARFIQIVEAYEYLLNEV